MRTVTVMFQWIGVEDDRIEVQAPALRRRDLRRSRWAGWVDRLRQRHVDDSRLTHYLHALEHEFRGHDTAVVTAVENGLSRIEAELSAVGLARFAAVPDVVAEPRAEELRTATGAARQAWAAALRQARARNRQAADALGSRAAAGRRHEALLAHRQALLVEGAAVRRLWQEAFEECACVYTRARSGLFGRRPSEDPEVPVFRPAEGPELRREFDGRSTLAEAPGRPAEELTQV